MISEERARFHLVVVALWALGASLGACATAPSSYDYSREPDPRHNEYAIGAADTVKVTVRDNPDLTAEAVVRPDGTIGLPLIGEIRAAGMTTTQLRAEIARRATTFVKEVAPAAVGVTITAINSYRFTVAGNVEKPGVFTSARYVTVTEAIVLAGGPNNYASSDAAVIIRATDGGARRIPVNYPAILKGERPEQNLALLPGDMVYVP
jgi:polysaccharide export outer membrane protein